MHYPIEPEDIIIETLGSFLSENIERQTNIDEVKTLKKPTAFVNLPFKLSESAMHSNRKKKRL